MALIKCPECKKTISDHCENCPNCGYPISKICDAEKHRTNDIERIDETASKKAGSHINRLFKKWWFWVAVGVLIVTIISTAVFLLNRDTKPKFDEDGNPVFVELTNEVYTNANKYLGYYINIKGKVFQVMSDNGGVKGIQIWIDPDTCEQNMMIYYNTDVEVKQGDYIMCSGYIDSVTEYKNVYDAKLFAPMVISTDLKKATYIDVMAPTTATITPENLKQEKYGYSISIDKIEFAEKETRVYSTATNNGKAMMNVGDAVIVQNGKQYNSTDNYEADYDEIPYEIVKGVSCSGIIVFPAIEINDFELTIDLHSDDFDEELDNFTFKISKSSVVIPEAEPPKQEGTTPPESNTTNLPSSQSPTNTNNAAIVVAKSFINAYECATPNALRDHMKSNGYSDAQINHAMNSGELDWTSDIKDIIWSYNSEAEGITVTNCIRCHRKFYGEYYSCQYLNCGGGVNWSYYHGYSRADTINKLLGLGFSKADVDATMKDYEYGEFIDEKDLSDCIKVTGKLCEHFWNSATCQELSSCPYCGETKGGYAEHEYSNRKCIWCEKEEPWTPPQISCSSWVSLKELQEKAGYYITTPGNTITIEDLNDDRVSFVLNGFPGAWQNGDTFDLDCNGITVHCKTDSDSNYVYQMIKLQYSDLVAIGVLS